MTTTRDLEAILGADNIFGVDDDGEAISIGMTGDYMSPYEPITNTGDDDLGDWYIPLEEWKASIDRLWNAYRNGKVLLEQAFPGWKVTIGEEAKHSVIIPSDYHLTKLTP
jgi:hypothetical protein